MLREEMLKKWKKNDFFPISNKNKSRLRGCYPYRNWNQPGKNHKKILDLCIVATDCAFFLFFKIKIWLSDKGQKSECASPPSTCPSNSRLVYVTNIPPPPNTRILFLKTYEVLRWCCVSSRAPSHILSLCLPKSAHSRQPHNPSGEKKPHTVVEVYTIYTWYM